MESESWLIARRESEGILFASLKSGQRLNPLNASFMEESSVKHWEAIIFCPQGLSSRDLRQPTLDKIQSWYIDIQTGSVFPYPPSGNHQIVNLAISYLEQPSIPEFNSNLIIKPSKKPRTTVKEHLRKKPFLTYTLIIINLIVFFLMTLSGGSTQRNVLIQFGAKVNELILQGEFWRFFTSMFIHIGFIHLVFNLYALWALGPISEELIGRLRYLVIYLLSGITGSIVSFFFVDALSAGASGAIFGLLGALVSTTRKDPKLWRSGFGKNLVIIILINLSLGLFQPGIDIYAHFGGLICGLFLGRLFP